MTLVFLTGMLAGIAVAWTWYVVANWKHDRDDLNNAWVVYPAASCTVEGCTCKETRQEREPQ